VPSSSVDNWGMMSTAGIHFTFGETKAFIEPMLTLAYQDSSLDDVTALGATGTFTDADTLRGAIGARLGGILMEGDGLTWSASLTGRYWDEFNTHTNMVLSSAGPSLGFSDNGRQAGFGEVSGALELAGNSGLSGFISPSAKFNNDFTTVQVNGGVRYRW